MTFKEEIANDIDTVFFNMEDFAEVHQINGEELTVVLYVDDNMVHEGGSTHNYDGLSSDVLTVAIKRSDLGERLPAYKENFNVDGKRYKVKSVSEQMGVIYIQLMSYRGGGAR